MYSAWVLLYMRIAIFGDRRGPPLSYSPKPETVESDGPRTGDQTSAFSPIKMTVEEVTQLRDPSGFLGGRPKVAQPSMLSCFL